MKFGVVRFPGSNCDQDAYHAIADVLRQPVDYIWHQERSVKGYDCIVLPGGFSYGDYLRTGAIARFSPVIEAVIEHAQRGRLLIGICNGFQVLCETHLLPGALVRNTGLKFVCRQVHLRVENASTPFTRGARPGQVLRMPIAHGEGRYVADQPTLAALRDSNRIVVRYCDARGETTPESNPNGSVDHVAGVVNESLNVFGLMPHPERAAARLLGSTDGRVIMDSIVRALRAAV
ncbi:MAG TPA: phosphoribosylformylglycinamidine synthase subunit PurQ [Chthonomonadales bacterium]|nr:phosphoribosylformylglycinamidine synthase subunit PurQ [Chthonomonadales bacterium]